MGPSMHPLKFDSIDELRAHRVSQICGRHITHIEALMASGDLEGAFRKVTGLAMFYHPDIYRLLASLYRARGSVKKFWPALIMSGIWSHEQEHQVFDWMTQFSKDGPSQLRSRFPTCFRMRYARPLMPDRVVTLLLQFEFFVFRKKV
jgi:hypothetical protein